MTELILLTGGPSPEWGASVRSYQNLVQHLYGQRELKVSGILVDDGQFYYREGFAPERWEQLKQGVVSPLHHLPLLFATKQVFVFNLLCGGWGEDGHLQAMAEVWDWRGTFCSQRSAVLTMEKPLLSSWVEQTWDSQVKRIPSLAIEKLTSESKVQQFIDEAASREFILKPQNSGSSLGCRVVKADKVQGSVRALPWKDQPRWLLQERILGQEYTVGILKTKKGPEALPVLRLEGSHGILDESAKKTPDGIRWIPTQSALTNDLGTLSQQIFQALNLKYLARFDWITNEKGSYFLEVNLVPGLTSRSPFSFMLEASNFTWENIVIDWVEEARQC